MTKLQKYGFAGWCVGVGASAAQAGPLSAGPSVAHGLAMRMVVAIINVPEPGVLALTGGAMLALIGFARIRSKKR